MLNQHHPDDERLSALASRDADATADAALASHVESCARCTDLVAELGALRMSLAELPDLRPHRPLQLVPPVAAQSSADGAAGWIRRFFAPALAAGAALAMVGLVGTAAPALDGMASGGISQDVGTSLAAPGASFVPLAFAESHHLPRPGEKPGVSAPNRFYMYGVIGRLAMLAASYELEATDPDAEVYE